MWLKDKNQKLEGSILRDKLKLDVDTIKCAVDARGWLMAHIKTRTKHRSNEILKVLMGEDAFKAMKQPDMMRILTLDYNQCVPSEGHKIQGADGIEIFANSKDTKNDFKIYSDIINEIMEGKKAGKYLGEWKHDHAIAQERQESAQWAADDVMQQKAIAKDPPALGNVSDSLETESENDSPMKERRPASDAATPEQPSKRARTSLARALTDSILVFSDKYMESTVQSIHASQRAELVENAELRVQIADMKHEVKDLTQRLQKSEELQQEMEADHAKVVLEMTQKLAAAAEVEGIEAKIRDQLQQADGLVERLTDASGKVAKEAKQMADLNRELFHTIIQLEKELKQIEDDFAKNTKELIAAKKEVEDAAVIRSWNEKHVYILTKDLYQYKVKYDGPEFKDMKMYMDQLQVENRTLREVIRHRINARPT